VIDHGLATMSDLVKVTFCVVPSWGTVGSRPNSERIAEVFTEKWGGVDVTVEPTDVRGEYRVTGLFPREFAEAREYK
jgi:hypothetical protein